MCSTCVGIWCKNTLQMLVQCSTVTVHKHITNKQERTTFASTDSEELFPHEALKTLQAVQEQQWIPALLSLCRWGLQVSYSHASWLTLFMYILLDAERWTCKKYRMAFQSCGFSYKRVTLHRVKTKIDIYNSIPGIFCCLYKFAQLIKLYGIHTM